MGKLGMAKIVQNECNEIEGCSFHGNNSSVALNGNLILNPPSIDSND